MPPPSSTLDQPPGLRWPVPACAAPAARQPDTSASRSSLDRRRPVMASSTSSTAESRRTRRSRGSQQRRPVGAGDENEDRRAERRRRLEAHGAAPLEAGQHPAADPGLAGPAAHGDLRRQRAHAPGRPPTPTGTLRRPAGQRSTAPRAGGWLPSSRRPPRRARAASATGRARHTVIGQRLPSLLRASLILRSIFARSICSPSPASARRQASTASAITAALRQQVAPVVLDDRVSGQLLGGRAEIRLGQVELVQLEVRPAEAVEIRAVVGIEGDGPLDERHGLVEAAAPLDEGVAEVVEGRAVIGVPRDDLAEDALGVGVQGLPLEHGAVLEQHPHVVGEARHGVLQHARRLGVPVRGRVVLGQVLRRAGVARRRRRPASGAPPRPRRTGPARGARRLRGARAGCRVGSAVRSARTSSSARSYCFAATQRLRQIHASRAVGRVERRRALEGRHGVGVPADFEVREAEMRQDERRVASRPRIGLRGHGFEGLDEGRPLRAGLRAPAPGHARPRCCRG